MENARFRLQTPGQLPGGQKRFPISYLRAAVSGAFSFGTFNIASGSSFAVYEVADLIRRKVNPQVKITYSDEI